LRYPQLLSVVDVAQDGDAVHCVTEAAVPLLSLPEEEAPGVDESVLGMHALAVRARDLCLCVSVCGATCVCVYESAAMRVGGCDGQRGGACMQQALAFLHTTGQLAHGNIALASVFVAPGNAGTDDGGEGGRHHSDGR
jgi:hypothetical protein